MKTPTLTILAAASLASLVLTCGCGKTRGNADVDKTRAATPQEGGATLTQGSAGDAKNFGDTRATTQQTGVTPSESPTGWSKDAKAGAIAPATPPATTTAQPATSPNQTPPQKE